MVRTMLLIGTILATVSGTARGQEPAVLSEPITLTSGFQHHSSVAPLFRHRPAPCYPECPPVTPSTPVDPMNPPPIVPPEMQGLTSPFATGTEGGGLQGRAFNEAFDGDFGGISYCKNVITGSTLVTRQTGTRQETRTIFVDGVPRQITVTVPVFGTFVVPTVREALVPVPGRYSGITITDNDSPRPVDRFYFNYGYYDGMNAQLNPGVGNITQSRPMIGFEKTFLAGNASFGMRLPFVQINGPPGADANSVGDLSILTKYAFVNDPNGDVLSAGLIVTVPTGANAGLLCDGTPVPHSTLFQPWLGFVRVYDRAYLQGFTAVIVPTDRRDITLLANSLGAGYWLYRADGDRMLQGVIPILEVHIRTPLNGRDPNGTVYMQDQVNVTGGLHLRFPRATLGGAVCVPTLAPRPWNVEAIANFTYRF